MLTRSDFLLGVLAAVAAAGQAFAQRQARADLYDCEDCQVAAETDADGLSWRMALAGPDEPGEPMIARGVVYAADGVTPAPDVVIYVHQTNAEGRYADGDDTLGGRRHGRLRGWVKTGADGAYEVATIKPGPYPGRDVPAHVHLYIWEPGRTPYWIDDVVFAGEFDPNNPYMRGQTGRGGLGVTALRQEGDVLVAERNIVLEPHPE